MSSSSAAIADEIVSFAKSLTERPVVVFGDLIVDEYQYCTLLGRSASSPMLVLAPEALRRFAGGAIPVANRAAMFSRDVTLVLPIALNSNELELVGRSLAPHVRLRPVLRNNWHSIVKRRIVDAASGNRLMELCESSPEVVSPEEDAELVAVLDEALEGGSVSIVCDFGHGAVRDCALPSLYERSQFLAINTQSNAANHPFHTASRYEWADFLCLTEYELRLDRRDRTAPLSTLMMDASDRLGGAAVAMTRGSEGSSFYDGEGAWCTIPSMATDVIDAVGAGDAYFATSALFTSVGASPDAIVAAASAVAAECLATEGHPMHVAFDRVITRVRQGASCARGDAP